MSGAAAVFRYDGATPTQIGNTFGSAENSDADYMGKNRVIQFQNELYALHNLGVYKLQGDGVTWSNASIDGGFVFTSPSTGIDNVKRSGLYPVVVGGQAFLVGAYSVTGSNLTRFIRMDAATGTWANRALGGQFMHSAVPGGYLTEIVYQNRFYVGYRNGSNFLASSSFDPLLNTITDHAITNASGNNSDICIHNNRLFKAVNSYFLFELVAGSWVSKGDVLHSLNRGWHRPIRNSLFPNVGWD
jgi:hypothetical protein